MKILYSLLLLCVLSYARCDSIPFQVYVIQRVHKYHWWIFDQKSLKWQKYKVNCIRRYFGKVWLIWFDDTSQPCKIRCFDREKYIVLEE